MEPPSPIEAIGFNPVPSRFINKSSLRRFPVLIEERGIENKGMTVESSVFLQTAGRKRITKENGSIYKSSRERVDSRN